MKQMSRRAILMLLFLLLFSVGLVVLGITYVAQGDSWAYYPANRHIYTNAVLTGAGTITDRSGQILAQTADGKRAYHTDAAVRRAVLHTVGDGEGFIKTGVQNYFWKKLVGYNLFNGVYQPSGRGNDISLTIDGELCATALQALGRYNGTVAVYNYKTGEVLCMVSAPTYDVNNKPDIEGNDKYEGVYLNRFLSAAYPPGSTFKLVTASAALQTADGIMDRTYTCRQGVEIEGEWVSCTGNHGTIGFRDALAQSCNAYFAQLAVDLGPETLTKYAEKMGYNQNMDLDGIPAKSSTVDFSHIRNIDLAWAGMGQYTNMANPLQALTMVGAIANGGVPVKPYFIESITSPAGLPLHYRAAAKGSRMMSEQAAETLADMMRYTVTKKYGDSSFPGLHVGAKTGTAEVGAGITPHSWMVGFVEDDNCPLAFVVVAENGDTGVGTARKIANVVLQKASQSIT